MQNSDVNSVNSSKHSIVFDKVSYAYPNNLSSPVIGDVSFKVNKGEIIGIFGANGSGKSTLAKLAAGLIFPTSGNVFINGIPSTNTNLIRKSIGYLFQDPDNQIIGLTVEEDLAFGLENYNIPPDEIKKRVYDISKKFNLTKILLQPINYLSSGIKQKVAIASVIILSPDYIILDEPLAYLDPWNRKEITNLLLNLYTTYNFSIIILSPKVSYINIIHKALIINKGQVVYFDAISNLWKLPPNTLESWGLFTPDEIVIKKLVSDAS